MAEGDAQSEPGEARQRRRAVLRAASCLPRDRSARCAWRNSVGVTPVAARNARVKALWSEKPHACAISATARGVSRRASEAAAMLGLSPYVTRSELLHRKATGIELVNQLLEAHVAQGGAALVTFAVLLLNILARSAFRQKG